MSSTKAEATVSIGVMGPGKRKANPLELGDVPPAKKGRPSKLSPSQRRKLARLYLFTNMRIEDICEILGFCHMVVKKRTVQNILREMLTDKYTRLRPKDKIARRRRVAEIELVHATIGVDKEQPGLGYSHAVEQPPERSELPASSSSHGLNQSTADGCKAVCTGELVKDSDEFANCDNNSHLCDFIDLEMASKLLGTERTTIVEGSNKQDDGDLSFNLQPSKDYIGQIGPHKLETAAERLLSSRPVLDDLPPDLHCEMSTQAVPIPDPLMAAVSDTAKCDKEPPPRTPDIFISPWITKMVYPVDTTSLSWMTPTMEVLTSSLSPNNGKEVAAKEISHVPSETLPPTTRATDTVCSPSAECKKWSSYEKYTSEDYAKQLHALCLPPKHREITNKQSLTTPSDALIQSPAQMTQMNSRSALIDSKPGPFNEKKRPVNFLSPCVNRMSGYSPAHIEDIKKVFRNSPSFYGVSPCEVPFQAQQTFDSSNSQRTSITEIVPSSREVDSGFSRIEEQVIGRVSRVRRWKPDNLQESRVVGHSGHASDHEFVDFQSQKCPTHFPGAFVYSEINSLKHSSNCEAKNTPAADWRFCEACGAESYLSSIWTTFNGFKSDETSLNFSDRFGNTVLHVAAAVGMSGYELGELVKRTPDINAVNTAGETFMHVLAPPKVGYETQCLLLVLQRSGFDFHKRDHQGQTFVHALVRRGADPRDLRAHLYLLLLKDSTGKSISKEAVEYLTNNEIIVQQHDKDVKVDTAVDNLFELPHDTHQYDSNGTTALIRALHNTACADGAVPSLESLQSLIASVNYRDGTGRSPLHYAVASGEIEATKFLLNNGANVHARDARGKGVLVFADENQLRHLDPNHDPDPAMCGRIAACKVLAIDAGAIREPTLFDEWDLR